MRRTRHELYLYNAQSQLNGKYFALVIKYQ